MNLHEGTQKTPSIALLITAILMSPPKMLTGSRPSRITERTHQLLDLPNLKEEAVINQGLAIISTSKSLNF